MILSHQRGLNLVELLVTLSIVSILISMAIPSLANIHNQNKRSTSVQQAKRLIFYTRAEAAKRRSPVTLCLSNDGIHCDRRADKFMLVFVDNNNNQQAEKSEILRLEKPRIPGTKYLLKASNRDTIRYKANGYLMDFGSLYICPAGNDRHYAARLILSRSGRPRHAKDLNNDGIVEDSDGNPIDCSAL